MFDSKTAEALQANWPFDQSYPRLVADIGGTNARFGWIASAAQPAASQVRIYACANHNSLADAISRYLADEQLPRPVWAAVAIANPVTGDLVQMTNHHWQFSVGQLRSQLGLQRLLVLNDFTALALALPELAAEHKQAVGLAQPASTVDAHSCIGLIGPGTGLGVSGLLWSGKQWTPLQGEGGHVSLAAANAKEFELIRILQQRYGHVSAERVVSGGGLVDLYHAVAMQLKHSPQEVTTAAQVLALAQQGSGDEIAKATLNQFTEFLGSVAGDLALTLGATGGIYLGGGILPKMGELFDQTLFRNRFEAKGRFKTYLQSIPVWLLQTPVSPALQGANLALHLQ